MREGVGFGSLGKDVVVWLKIGILPSADFLEIVPCRHGHQDSVKTPGESCCLLLPLCSNSRLGSRLFSDIARSTHRMEQHEAKFCPPRAKGLAIGLTQPITCVMMAPFAGPF